MFRRIVAIVTRCGAGRRTTGLYYTVGTAISISINGMHAIINHGSRRDAISRGRRRK